MASCRPNRPASAVWRERSECAGTRGRAAGASARKAIQHGSLARLWSQRRERRVIAAALEDASVGGAPAAGCLLFVYQHHLGSAPRPPGPARPHPAPPASVPRGWLGPPSPARWRPPPPGPTQLCCLLVSLGKTPPVLPPVCPFQPGLVPKTGTLSFRNLLLQIPFRPSFQQALLSPWGFLGTHLAHPILSCRLFLWFTWGVFSSKVGPTQQRCLHGRFLFSFFLLLDLLSLFKTSLIRSVGSSI